MNDKINIPKLKFNCIKCQIGHYKRQNIPTSLLIYHDLNVAKVLDEALPLCSWSGEYFSIKMIFSRYGHTPTTLSLICSCYNSYFDFYSKDYWNKKNPRFQCGSMSCFIFILITKLISKSNAWARTFFRSIENLLLQIFQRFTSIPIPYEYSQTLLVCITKRWPWFDWT